MHVLKTVCYETLELLHENNTDSWGEKNETKTISSNKIIRIAEQFGLQHISAR